MTHVPPGAPAEPGGHPRGLRECGNAGMRQGWQRDILVLSLVAAGCPRRGRGSGSSPPVLPAASRCCLRFQLPGMMDRCQSRPGSGRGPRRE